jgi:hypothetical protein
MAIFFTEHPETRRLPKKRARRRGKNVGLVWKDMGTSLLSTDTF